MENQNELVDEEMEYILDEENMKDDCRTDEPWDLADQQYEEWRDEKRHLEVEKK